MIVISIKEAPLAQHRAGSLATDCLRDIHNLNIGVFCNCSKELSVNSLIAVVLLPGNFASRITQFIFINTQRGVKSKIRGIHHEHDLKSPGYHPFHGTEQLR